MTRSHGPHIVRVMRTTVGRALVAACVCGAAVGAGVAPAHAETVNRALGTRLGGAALTGVDLEKVLATSHTFTVRFAPKYPFMHAGAVLGAKGGDTFQIGVGEFRTFQSGGFGSWTPRGVLQVRLGDRLMLFRLADDPGTSHRWVHLAVSIARPTPGGDGDVRTYIDGKAVLPDRCVVVPANPGTPPSSCPGAATVVPGAQLDRVKGVLMLGRHGAAAQPVKVRPDTADDDAEARRELYLAAAPTDDQFYGLIDDVGVFRGALTPKSISARAAARRLTGLEPNLRIGYNFDVEAKSTGRRTEPRRRLGSVKVTSKRAGLLAVSRLRSPAWRNDGPIGRLRPPHSQRWILPFDRGQEWLVLWGNNTYNSSHNGYASFSWDFVLADEPNAKTCGQRLRAVAPGAAHAIDDDGVSDRADLHPDATNIFQGWVTYQERFGFLHIQTNSVRELFSTATPPPAIPFQRGQVVARAGNRNLPPGTNCHLHMSSFANGESTTPAEFSNYEVKNRGNGVWEFYSYGVPSTGQIVRNPPAS